MTKDEERLERLWDDHWRVERSVIHAEKEVEHQKVFLRRIEYKINCLEGAEDDEG